ncbi:hypothetical protein ACG3SL_17930 [Sphingomonas sp. CJ20]
MDASETLIAAARRTNCTAIAQGRMALTLGRFEIPLLDANDVHLWSDKAAVVGDGFKIA